MTNNSPNKPTTKEFPFDRFFRHHKGKIILFLIALMVFALFAPVTVPVVYHPMLMNMLLSFIAVFMVVGMGMFVWQIYWHVKYPPKYEYCKECGRVLPIKYED